MTAPMIPPLAERFLAQRQVYKVPLERFLRIAGLATDEQVKAFRRRQAAEAREAAHKEYAAGTVHYTFTAAREFYRWLLDMEEIDSSPLNDFKIKAKRNVSSWNVLYRGEPEKLLSATKDPVLRAIIIGLVDHGFRVSELCGLTWGQVRKDGGDRLVVDFKGKGSKDALIVLTKRFTAAIGTRASTSAPLIPAPGTAGKEHLTRFQAHEMVVSLCQKVLGRKVTPHGFRAAYISKLVAEKGLATAQRLARHEDTTTTMRYYRWNVEAGEADE